MNVNYFIVKSAIIDLNIYIAETISIIIQGGVYIFQLMDFYAASGMSLLWCTFFQTIAICWIFGGKKMYDCIETMVGFRINWYWYVCWMVTAPAFMLVSVFCESLAYPYNRIKTVSILSEMLIMIVLFIFSSCLYSISRNTLRSRTQKPMNTPGGERLLGSV